MTTQTHPIAHIESLQLQQLAQRFMDGDRGAFGELYERLRGVMMGAAMRILRREADAEDVVQDAFLRAWKARERLREPARVKAWLVRIAVNLARTHCGRRGREVESVEAHELVCEHTAQDAMEAAESRQRLKAAIGALTPRQCQVITLRVERELSFKEVSEEIGCSNVSARVNFTYGVRALKEVLAA